ncbi:LysR substrate-binding domain-containing protein, partial [Salmonella enterica]|uniref:LysR substrate-binding domain-containing protein n=1 Tax=Salmonella enterica TaxID=28901 RepID=UPI003D2A864E
MLATFQQRHPGVVVETLTDPRVYSLARREADLVLRIAPFDEPEVIARRLVTVPYALYAPAGHGALGGDVPVVVMDTGFGGMPDV